MEHQKRSVTIMKKIEDSSSQESNWLFFFLMNNWFNCIFMTFHIICVQARVSRCNSWRITVFKYESLNDEFHFFPSFIFVNNDDGNVTNVNGDVLSIQKKTRTPKLLPKNWNEKKKKHENDKIIIRVHFIHRWILSKHKICNIQERKHNSPARDCCSNAWRIV